MKEALGKVLSTFLNQVDALKQLKDHATSFLDEVAEFSSLFEM
jgi:hypothetical protein